MVLSKIIVHPLKHACVYIYTWRGEAVQVLDPGVEADTPSLGCSMTPGEKYILFGLNANIIGAQKQKKVKRYGSEQPCYAAKADETEARCVLAVRQAA